jgi:hypothetical protein
MSNFVNTYFGPLGKDWCVYFLILSMFFLFIFVTGAISAVLLGLKNYKNLDFMMILHSVALLGNSLLAYYVNRLLYTMCLSSIH